MISEAQLAILLEEAYDVESDSEVNPAEARQRIAQKQAEAIAQFVQGRQTIVTGTSSDGATVAGTGIIQ
ncbi:MAG TPA: hypothetical protein DHV22_08080 [Xanthomarina gelatinilytica]|uniref:Uncharacterized protein n=1 Tax=Xanthomarina gelatinilytica TaxID=1137281 RepID=A0A3D6BQK3_9FLAO|nr:hypothetical protein [Xanthomarina gelatinilytica]